jgi:N-acetylglucosamine kinase-like BadF-type ATPase
VHVIGVIGIDAGGSKTVCQLGDAEGHVLRESRGPGANLQSAGELEVEKVLHDVLSEVLADVAQPPAAICLGMAGVDRPADGKIVQGILRRLCRGSQTLVVNDALVALEAGAPGQPGVVLIAGTGSIAYGRDERGRAARAGGWGHVLGDEGSGFWMGRQAIRAVMRAFDHRGAATSMAAPIMAHFGVSRAQDLVRPIYDDGMRPRAIAAVAPIVGEAADSGDAVATRIIDVGAGELAGSAVCVATRLDLTGRGFALPLAGGVFRSVPRVRALVIARLAEQMPSARPELLEAEPASGAVRLAAALVRGTARVPVYFDAAD